MIKSKTARPPDLHTCAERIVDQQLAELEAHLASGYHQFLFPEVMTDDANIGFDQLIEAVKVEGERECKAQDCDPGPRFEHDCYARAGYLLGLAYGRRLVGAR